MNKHKHTNKLIEENSPYLLQHAHNPVNWYPWGKEALEKAETENKLLLISIGYSACHWCHVMERESFENEEIAAIMNKHYVCIKVDREERPDIDQIYMNAVRLITGGGGWPLNCFALPNGKPIYGGTYFRPQQWKQVLQGLNNTYQHDKAKVLQIADELSEGIATNEFNVANTEAEIFTKNDISAIIDEWKPYFDKKYGGNNRAPKFPLPNSYEFLLRSGVYLFDNQAVKQVELTLDNINSGGIHDQLGGGFARYSTDIYWKVPHFEKMLYDNGQLLSLYSLAYQYTKDAEYRRAAYRIISFVDRELSSSEGAFYSSLDADSEGEEGKYYVWTKQELEAVLGDDAKLYCDFYNVKSTGNWEHNKNILYRGGKDYEAKLAKKHNISSSKLMAKIDKLNDKLLKIRSKRIAPALDNKIIASWNGLMLKGFADAYRVFNDNDFLDRALENAEFIEKNMIDNDYKLYRNYTSNEHRINGFLDDYAFVIDAYIALYQATFNEKWINLAKNLCNYAIKYFYDSKTKMFFYTSELDEKLIVRKMEIDDNVIPASNSAMAKNLYVLATIFYDGNYMQMSKAMLSNVRNDIEKSGAYYSNWGLLLSNFVETVKEVAIVGKNAEELRKEFDQHYLPNYIFAGSQHDSNLPILQDRYKQHKTSIYVCENKVCKQPVYSVKDALGK